MEPIKLYFFIKLHISCFYLLLDSHNPKGAKSCAKCMSMLSHSTPVPFSRSVHAQRFNTHFAPLELWLLIDLPWLNPRWPKWTKYPKSTIFESLSIAMNSLYITLYLNNGIILEHCCRSEQLHFQLYHFKKTPGYATFQWFWSEIWNQQYLYRKTALTV